MQKIYGGGHLWGIKGREHKVWKSSYHRASHSCETNGRIRSDGLQTAVQFWKSLIVPKQRFPVGAHMGQEFPPCSVIGWKHGKSWRLSVTLIPMTRIRVMWRPQLGYKNFLTKRLSKVILEPECKKNPKTYDEQNIKIWNKDSTVLLTSCCPRLHKTLLIHRLLRAGIIFHRPLLLSKNLSSLGLGIWSSSIVHFSV